MAPKLKEATCTRVAVAIDDPVLAHQAARALQVRGLHVDELESQDGPPPASVVGIAPREPISPAAAATLRPRCAAAAAALRPVVILAPEPGGKQASEETAALAYLRAWGAAVVFDPDVWLEALVLVAAHGMPTGSRIALVAEPGSWLGLAAQALRREAQPLAPRVPPLVASAEKIAPADLALVDREALPSSHPERVARALVVPVAARGELFALESPRGATRTPLVGLRAALGAAWALGHLAERIAAGLGPADIGQMPSPPPDERRFARQVEQLGDRAGDHETKVLLAAYGVGVTRQAVATTPSAATRVAKRAGFPVEVKPWGPDQPSEAAGCPVEKNLETAADVRRAFAAVAMRAGLLPGAAVIVRAAPPPGRELVVSVRRIGDLDWTVVVEIAGAAAPAAAPAPLRPVDAAALANLVVASRAGEPEPDRKALADLLLRASHLAARHQDVIERLELDRIVLADPRSHADPAAVVVDAHARLIKRQSMERK